MKRKANFNELLELRLWKSWFKQIEVFNARKVHEFDRTKNAQNEDNSLLRFVERQAS